jgi:hypothetical protein
MALAVSTGPGFTVMGQGSGVASPAGNFSDTSIAALLGSLPTPTSSSEHHTAPSSGSLTREGSHSSLAADPLANEAQVSDKAATAPMEVWNIGSYSLTEAEEQQQARRMVGCDAALALEIVKDLIWNLEFYKYLIMEKVKATPDSEMVQMFIHIEDVIQELAILVKLEHTLKALKRYGCFSKHQPEMPELTLPDDKLFKYIHPEGAHFIILAIERLEKMNLSSNYVEGDPLGLHNFYKKLEQGLLSDHWYEHYKKSSQQASSGASFNREPNRRVNNTGDVSFNREPNRVSGTTGSVSFNREPNRVSSSSSFSFNREPNRVSSTTGNVSFNREPNRVSSSSFSFNREPNTRL